MTDAELGKLVHTAFDDVGLDDASRDRLRAAVTAARARTTRGAGARGIASPTATDDVERRARAFRMMAGVRV